MPVVDDETHQQRWSRKIRWNRHTRPYCFHIDIRSSQTWKIKNKIFWMQRGIPPAETFEEKKFFCLWQLEYGMWASEANFLKITFQTLFCLQASFRCLCLTQNQISWKPRNLYVFQHFIFLRRLWSLWFLERRGKFLENLWKNHLPCFYWKRSQWRNAGKRFRHAFNINLFKW